MSQRRILTAREQYELLTPWQKHAEAQYSRGAQEDMAAANKLLPSEWQELMKAPGTMRLPVGVEADDTKPSVDACAKCKGSGRKNFGVCNQCFGSGTTTETPAGSASDVLEGWSKDRENKDPSALRASDAEPWGNRLEQSLYKEFMEWWPNSKAAQERLPLLKEDKIPTNWRDYPNEPITHWLNAEDFMQERYPEAHTGSDYGYEHALPLLQNLSNGNISPKWLEEQGYVGTGNVITQAMLNLHNKLQGRKWLNDDMRRQYYQLMLKHVGPGARRLSSLLKAAGPAQDTLSEWTSTRDKNFGEHIPSVYGVTCPTCSGKGCHGCGFIGKVFSQDFQPKEAPIKDTVKPWANKLEQGLYQEFMEWWPESKANQTRSPDTVNTGWSRFPKEPLTHWLNVEDFLQERYPDAATGAKLGLEEAKPLLKRNIENNPMTPEEMEQHGYVGHGNVVTQAMLNLHNKLQGRTYDNLHDQRRYFELMLRHLGPDARYSARFWMAGYDPRKSVWTPEQKALAAELQSRLDYGWESGRLPRLDQDSPEHYTQALQEMILMNKEREQRSDADSLDLGYDPAYNDFEAGIEHGYFDKQARRFWAMPSPPPKGLRFTYDPEWVHPNAPADHAKYIGRVNAYVGDDEVGRLDWLKRGNPLTIVTDRKPGEVNHIFVHPDYRRQSVATEMYDWAKKNAVPELHHSPRRTDLGDKWVNYEEGRNRLIAHRFWAMADTTKWHPMIKHDEPGFASRMGLYHITIPDKTKPTGRRIGDLSYTKYTKGERHYAKDPEGGTVGGREKWRYMPRPHSEVYIDSLIVHPDFQGQGVAQSLVERLAQDHPDHRINPGATTQSGNDFTERLRKIIPEADDRLVPNYEPTVLDDSDTEDYNQNELSRLVNARRFWAMSPAEDAYDENPSAYHSSPEPKAIRRNDSGKWYHVSPHKLDVGTVLSPGGGESPYGEDHSMPKDRQNWVWMDGPEGMRTWYYGTLLGQVKKGVENPWAYIYEVEPSEGPHPWNGTGWEGHAAPSAKIIREIETDKYNRLPDHLGKTALKHKLFKRQGQPGMRFWKHATPPEDAYDSNIPHRDRISEPLELPGPWYHATDQELTEGTILTPSGGPTKYDFMYNHPRYQNRKNWVWMTPHKDMADSWGQHVYEVEPQGEGPHPWNGDGMSMTEFVSPRARIIRKVKP